MASRRASLKTRRYRRVNKTKTKTKTNTRRICQHNNVRAKCQSGGWGNSRSTIEELPMLRRNVMTGGAWNRDKVSWFGFTQ